MNLLDPTMYDDHPKIGLGDSVPPDGGVVAVVDLSASGSDNGTS